MATLEGVAALAVYRILVPAGVLVGLQRLLRSRGRPLGRAWRAAVVLYLGLGVAFAVPYLLLLSPGDLVQGSPALAVLRAVVLWPGLLLLVAGAALPVLPGPD